MVEFTAENHRCESRTPQRLAAPGYGALADRRSHCIYRRTSWYGRDLHTGSRGSRIRPPGQPAGHDSWLAPTAISADLAPGRVDGSAVSCHTEVGGSVALRDSRLTSQPAYEDAVSVGVLPSLAASGACRLQMLERSADLLEHALGDLPGAAGTPEDPQLAALLRHDRAVGQHGDGS